MGSLVASADCSIGARTLQVRDPQTLTHVLMARGGPFFPDDAEGRKEMQKDIDKKNAQLAAEGHSNCKASPFSVTPLELTVG